MSKARDIASAVPAPSTVSSAELGHLDGVTSAIQTQIDSKIAQATAINPTLVDAKGDIIAATAADTVARLAVGATNGMVLTVDSAEATGLKYALPAGANFTLLNAGGTALTGAQTVTVSGISGKNKILVLINNASAANAHSIISLRLNTDTGSNYYANGFKAVQGNPNVSFSPVQGAATNVPFFRMDQGSAGAQGTGYALIDGCNSAGVKGLQVAGSGETTTGTANMEIFNTGGYYDSSSTISSVSIFSSTGNLDAGTVFVYTSA